MEKSIEKFINYLDQQIEELVSGDVFNNLVSKYLPEVNYGKAHEAPVIMGVTEGITLDESKMPLEDYLFYDDMRRINSEIAFIKKFFEEEYDGGITINLDIVSKYLKTSNLNSKECFEVISIAIEKHMHYINMAIDECIKKKQKFQLYSLSKMLNTPPKERDKVFENLVYYDMPFDKLSEENKKKSNYVAKLINKITLDSVEERNFIEQLEEVIKHYFAKKDSYDNDDVEKLCKAFIKLGIDGEIISKLKTYLLKSIERREKEEVSNTSLTPISRQVKEEVVFPSKKELKIRLNALYHPEILKDKYFDYKDIDEILYLVKGLNLPDEKIVIILNDLFRCAIKNSNYYKFLYDKAVFMGAYKDVVQDIFDLEEMIREDGTTPDINVLLLSLYYKIEHIMIIDFEYEKNRQSNVLEKHKQKVN